MAEQATFESVLKAMFWDQMNKVYTTIPCIVVDVQNDLKEQRVSIQPSIDILNEDGSTFQRSVVVNVPLIFPASSTSALTFPVNKGDTVIGMFSMRAMEIFSEGDGRPAPPNNYAKFNQKDAIAVPGLFPRRLAINNPNKRTNNHDTKDTVIVHNIGTANEVEIRLKPNGSVIINSPNQVQINCQTAEVNAEQSIALTTPQLTVQADNTDWQGNINLTGNVSQDGSQTVSGDVTASGKSLVNHTHNMPNIQSGSTTKPTTPPV